MNKKKKPISYLKIFKIVDPLLQTLMIIIAFYIFDKRGTKYASIILNLLRLQVVSSVVSIFLRYSNKLKLERFISLALTLIWLILYKRFPPSHGLGPNFDVILGKGFTNISVYDSLLAISGISLGIWYFSICFREMRRIIKNRRKLRG